MAILANDNFNRADGGLGANWTESFQTGTGDWAILTNQIHPTGGNNDRSGYYWNPVTPPADQYSQLTVPVRDNGTGDAGPAARMAVAARTFYTYRIAGANTLAVQKHVAGVVTSLAGSAVAGAAGQTLRIECQGTSIRGVVNGTQDISATDSAIASGRFGLHGTELTEDLLRFDNWEGGDLFAGPVLLDTLASNANGATYASNSFTPRLNDLLVVFAAVTGTDSAGVMTDSQGLGFTRVATALKAASGDRIYAFIANALAAASAMTVTVDVTGNSGTGCILFVYGVDRMSKLGAAALKQSAQQDNQAAATPAPVFGSSVLTTNPTVGTVGNSTNPAALTPPAGWTEPTAPAGDTGHTLPPTGGETVLRSNGFTGTTVTWGSASASAFASLILELDASATVSVSVTGPGATGSVGTVTITAGARVNPTGPALVSAVGTVTVTIGGADVSVSVTGLAITITVGDEAITGTAVVNPTGPAATGAVGTPAITGTALVEPTAPGAASAVGEETVQAGADVSAAGNLIAAAVGDEAVTGTASVTPSGAAVTGAAGTPDVQGAANVSPTAPGAVSAVGDETVTAGADVLPAGNSLAATVGDEAVIGTAVVSPSGVAAASAVGEETVQAGADVPATGSQIISAVGDEAVTGAARVDPTGAAASSTVGTPAVTGAATVNPTGPSAASASGTPAITGAANVNVTGLAITSAVGTVTIEITGGGDVIVTVSGNVATSAVGDEAVTGAANVSPTGPGAASASGTPAITGEATVNPTGAAAVSAVGDEAVTGAAVVAPTGAAGTSAVGEAALTGTAVVTPSGMLIQSAVGSVTVIVPSGNVRQAVQSVTVNGLVAALAAGTVTVVVTRVRPVAAMARESLFALILAYLREGILTTDNFPTYPTTQGIWMFPGSSWQFRVQPAGRPPLSPGITLEFDGDRAEPNQGMDQVWNTTARFRIRVTPADAYGIAQKIDEALHRAGGSTPILDFGVVPALVHGNRISWAQARGSWIQRGTALLSDLTLELNCQYTTANL